MSVLGPFELDTIVLGDNKDTMAKMPENCIDFSMTSCPYFNWRPEYATWDTYAAYLDSMRVWFKGLFKVLKPGRRLVWNIPVIAHPDGYHKGLLPLPHDSVRLALAEGFLLRGEIFWDDPAGKDKWPTGSYPFGPSVLMRRAVEHLIVLQKPAPKSPPQYAPLPPELKPYNLMDKNFFRDRVSKQVWLIPPRNGSDGHDAAYPEALVDPCLRMWSRPGEIVFDPFMGSGTTALSAITWKRHFFGCEWLEKYKALAERLIEQRLFQLANEQMDMSAFFPELNTKPTYGEEIAASEDAEYMPEQLGLLDG